MTTHKNTMTTSQQHSKVVGMNRLAKIAKQPAERW